MVPRYHATTCTMGTIGTMPTTLPWYQGTMVPWYHEFRTLLGRPKADLSGGCGGRSPPLKKEKGCVNSCRILLRDFQIWGPQNLGFVSRSLALVSGNQSPVSIQAFWGLSVLPHTLFPRPNRCFWEIQALFGLSVLPQAVFPHPKMHSWN